MTIMTQWQRGERGMVLLVVVVIVALLSAVLVEFTFSTLVDLRLTETARDSARAYYLAKGGLQVGRRLLQEDENGYDGPNESWAQPIQGYPAGAGTVSIRMTDRDGRIDLNRLVTAEDNIDVVMRDRLLRLFEALNIDGARNLTNALIDWIDANEKVLPGGAESAYYQGLADPCQAKNAPFDDLAELARVRGFSADIRRRLAPHVTVHGDRRINVNTASFEVLLSLADEMTAQAANTIIAARRERPLKAVSDLKNLIGMESLYGFIFRYLKVTSAYYRIEARGDVGDGHSTLVATMEKEGDQLLYLKIE